MNRKHTISLWDSNIDPNVKLPPCNKSMTWIVTKDGKLDLEVEERSGTFYPRNEPSTSETW